MKLFGKCLIMSVVAFAATGCVSMRKYDSARAEILALQNTVDKRSEALDRLQQRYAALESEAKQQSDRNFSLEMEVENLLKDTARLGAESRQLTARYKRLLEEGSAEASRMLEELGRNQAALEERSARIAELEQTTKKKLIFGVLCSCC